MSKILVLGGTGYVGGRLIPALVNWRNVPGPISKSIRSGSIFIRAKEGEALSLSGIPVPEPRRMMSIVIFPECVVFCQPGVIPYLICCEISSVNSLHLISSHPIIAKRALTIFQLRKYELHFFKIEVYSINLKVSFFRIPCIFPVEGKTCFSITFS